MKKWLIFFCLIVFPVLAQEISDSTFTENNPNLIRNNEARQFNGGSFVYIQGISDKPQPKTWMDNMKIKLFGSMEIPNETSGTYLSEDSSILNPPETEAGIPIKGFFGESKEIRYVAHTSEWNFIIQPMDENIFSVRENIQFLLTEETHITRSWPTLHNNIHFIKAEIDNNSIDFEKELETAKLDFSVLPAGLHQINLNYTLSINFSQTPILPLVGGDWPLITDRLSGVILNGKIELKEPHFLLGKNDQEIPQNFVFQSDEQGNVFFMNNHILPAFTQIQLAGKFHDQSPEIEGFKPFYLSDSIVFSWAFFIILLYLIISACEIYFASLTYLLKRFKRITLNPFLRWFYRSGEIILGCVTLLLLTFVITLFNKTFLPYYYWIGLIFLSITGIIISDILIFYPKQKMIYQLHQTKGEK